MPHKTTTVIITATGNGLATVIADQKVLGTFAVDKMIPKEMIIELHKALVSNQEESEWWDAPANLYHLQSNR